MQSAFVEYLRARGWDVLTENIDFTDVVARRGAETIVAEVKGHTTSAGLDVDTLYGQLLRRMTNPNEETRYALVVPDSMRGVVERVPASVRDLLDIDVWLVDESSQVEPPHRV